MSVGPLLTIADDVYSEPLTNLIFNKLQAGVQVCAVKAPSFCDNRKTSLNDIAVLTGSTVIFEEVGLLSKIVINRFWEQVATSKLPKKMPSSLTEIAISKDLR